MIRSVLTASRTLLTLLFATTLSLTMLSGCGGGGGGGSPIPNADPTGYYDANGNATLDGGQLVVIDLQGIIHNNRLIMLSAAQGLSYDGTIVVTGNDYSGTLSVYDDGTLLGTAPVSGTITQGATVTGTLAGTGAGSGTFALNYAASNSQAAALARVENMNTWEGFIGGSTAPYRFNVNAGNVIHDAENFGGTFSLCEMNGTISPYSGTNLYSIAVVLTFCQNPAVNGVAYAGLATTRQKITADDTLVLIATNGTYSVAAEFDR